MAQPLRHDYGDASVAEAVEAFGRRVASKLGRGGNEEDQLRGPMEELLRLIGARVGIDTVPYGEVALKNLRARPDYAVDVGQSRVGYLELKAPGRHVPGHPQWRPTKHERAQWAKLSKLPNVIYSDGQVWCRYQYGEQKSPIAEFEGDIRNAQRPLRAIDGTFEALITDFLLWEPERPRTLAHLITIVAGLCRLLRDEVYAILRSPAEHEAREDLTILAEDWRDLLFPGLDNEGFADGYAQTIVFSLLLARVDGVDFRAQSLYDIAKQLGKKHSLIGSALTVLANSDATAELRTVETLRRVITVVDWSRLDDGKTDVYSELYERFLQEYSPELRRHSGSYYTPQPVARFLVDFVDEILRDKFDRSWGLASKDVHVVDPAMGTGTFLVEIVRSVAETVDLKQGEGARAGRLRDLFSDRLIGFEIQVAPYAVAELRLHEALKTRFEADLPRTELRFFTDALENPNAYQERLRTGTKELTKSHNDANRIKRETQVMVTIGNPPHVENAAGRAEWIEQRRDPKFWSVRERPSLDEFRAPGMGHYESDLSNISWIFWRWAIWKVFEAHPDDPSGIVAFITPASLIKASAFAGLRQYLRRICDEGWIIELSPEGNRPPMNTRVFGSKVGRELCIAIFARYGEPDPDHAAKIHYTAVHGKRADKLDQLRQLHPSAPNWVAARDEWYSSALPPDESTWASYPALSDLLPWRSRGVTSGRRWIYGPQPDVLRRRWQRLIDADLEEKRTLFREGRDRKVGDKPRSLPGFPPPTNRISEERGPCPEPIIVAFRSFDRQWIIPDNRLMEVPRPPLWYVRSDCQVYISELDVHSISEGPALIFTALIPDLHHFSGRSGGVRPLYRDTSNLAGNVSPGLLSYLRSRLRASVHASDLLAYIAAVTAHPAFTTQFQVDLRQPGTHVPITGDRDLWLEAVAVGRQVVWLHTFGERFAEAAAGRPFGALALTESMGIRIDAPIITRPGEMPDKMSYDGVRQTLQVGKGMIAPVDPAVYAYRVGGMHILEHWFNYRTENPRHMRRTSPLDNTNVTAWTSELTDEILAVVAVLTGCISVEPHQADLLLRICDGPLISTGDLKSAGVLPVPTAATKPPRVTYDGELQS